MTTICFYQDTRHEENLYWIQRILGIGYISRRNDGMTELRINGYEQVKRILENLKPFIRFKKIQAKALFEASSILSSVSYRKISRKQLVQLIDLILVIQNENYATKRKKNKDELMKVLGLTP